MVWYLDRPSHIFHQRCSHQIHEPNGDEDQNWKEQNTQMGFLQHQRVADIGDTIQGHKLQKRQEGPVEAVVMCSTRIPRVGCARRSGSLAISLNPYNDMNNDKIIKRIKFMRVQIWSGHKVFLLAT